MSRWRLWLPLLLFACFVTLAALMLTKQRSDFVQSRMVGHPAPYFALQPAVADRPGLSVEDLRKGKPRLLNIFASWCLPCIAEAPQLRALAERGVAIDGIAVRDRPDDLARFLARHGNPYERIGSDDLSEVQLALGSSGVPETFVIDGQGRITYQHIGDIRADDIATLLSELRKAS